MIFRKLQTLLVCGLFRHHRPETRYEGDRSRRRMTVRSRCGRVLSPPGTVVHPWGPWEADPGEGCRERRICPRCGAAETREAHRWGDWTEEDDRRCQSVCLDCGASGSRFHWGTDWTGVDENVCEAVCERCGATFRKAHDRRLAEPPVCQTCTRCGMGFDHEYQEDWEDYQNGVLILRCRNCRHNGGYLT